MKTRVDIRVCYLPGSYDVFSHADMIERIAGEEHIIASDIWKNRDECDYDATKDRCAHPHPAGRTGRKNDQTEHQSEDEERPYAQRNGAIERNLIFLWPRKE